MSSPFNIKKTTSVGRNGFDLSQRHLFNAAPGMLLPIMHEPCIPGDSFKLRLDSFTRMRPLNTAAFARFKEYYDFYYCSKDTLWPWYNSMVVNNNEPQQLPSYSSTSVPTEVPCVKDTELVSLIDSDNYTDDFGFPYRNTTSILFDLLGCGDFASILNRDDINGTPYAGTYLSLLPWAMYQQIYANYYRNPQWETKDVLSYNLRPFYNSTNRLGSTISTYYNMFKMRYANWHKDYFMGLYPSQQFGDVSVVSSKNFSLYADTPPSSGSFPLIGVSLSSGQVGTRNGTNSNLVSSNFTMTEGGLSIVDLRRAQALQRWKEVTMTNGSSMFQQVKAHYGFELPEGRKDAPEYIGGFDNVVTIQDVDATGNGSYTSDDGVKTSQVGQIFGKATAASDLNKTIDFIAKDFGYIMCIYHVEPYLEYDATGIKRSNLCLTAADEYIPEFDKIGFGNVLLQELFFPSFQNLAHESTSVLGYTSRYLDLKASYDRVHGSFRQTGTAYANVNDGAWTIALNRDYLNAYVGQQTSAPIDYLFFKVPPTIANNIMQVELESQDDGYIDQYCPFMVCASFNIYKTSNMSVDSLPY